MKLMIGALSGLIAGVASSLLGIGGGIVMVPLLVYFVVADIKTAVGTSLAFIVPIALSGALQHAWRGQVSWKVAAACVPLGLVGTYLGSELSDVTPDLALRRIFGVLMILVGLKMALSFGPGADEDETAAPEDARPQAERTLSPEGEGG